MRTIMQWKVPAYAVKADARWMTVLYRRNIHSLRAELQERNWPQERIQWPPRVLWQWHPRQTSGHEGTIEEGPYRLCHSCLLGGPHAPSPGASSPRPQAVKQHCLFSEFHVLSNIAPHLFLLAQTGMGHHFEIRFFHHNLPAWWCTWIKKHVVTTGNWFCRFDFR